MPTNTTILSTCWLNQSSLGSRPARTLLVGAALLTVSHRFGTLAFDLRADSTTITDDPDGTVAWLAERLPTEPGRLLLWRADDIVLPSLISAAETTRNLMAGARLLCALERAFTGEMVDVAEPHGRARAKSFDAVAHAGGLPFVPMTRAQLAEAHRTGCHGDIRLHLAGRAKATWRLWLRQQEETAPLQAMTDEWLASPDAELRL